MLQSESPPGPDSCYQQEIIKDWSLLALVYNRSTLQAKAGGSGVQVQLGLLSEFQDLLGSIWRETLTRDFFLLWISSVFLFVKWGTMLSVAFLKRCCEAKSILKFPCMEHNSAVQCH